MTSTAFTVRPASIADIGVIARHRAEMFRDIHELSDALCVELEDASRIATAQLMDAGEYFGWLASPAEEPGTIVAGAGMQIRPALPSIRHRDGSVRIRTGRQGLIVNVYTEREWRRRGLARLIMTHLLADARAHDLGSIVLHASRDGRALYESLGFEPTNEMRFTGPMSWESD